MAEYAKIFVVIGNHAFAIQVSHGHMRLDVMSGLITRAVIGAHTALDAAGFCSVDHGFGFKMAAGDKIMVFRKNDDVAVGLGDDKLVNVFVIIMNFAHHRSAHNNCIVGNGGVCCFYTLTNGGSKRHMEHNRVFDLAYYAEEFIGNGFAVIGVHNVKNGTYVIDNRTDHQRNAPLGDGFSGNFANDNLLVTGGIEISHFVEFNVTSCFGDSFFKSSNFGFVCCLEGYVLFVGAKLFSNHVNAFNKVCRSCSDKELISFNKRFALCCVYDEVLRFSVEFYMGRKSCAARTDNTGIFNGFD